MYWKNQLLEFSTTQPCEDLFFFFSPLQIKKMDHKNNDEFDSGESRRPDPHYECKKNFTAIPDMPLHHHPSVRTGDELLPLIAAIRGKSQSGVKPLSPIPEWMKVCRNQDLKLNIRGTHVPICFAPPVYDPTSPVEYNSYFYLLLPLPFFFSLVFPHESIV